MKIGKITEIKKRRNKMSNKQTEERLEQANQLLDEIAEGEYGDTLEDIIQWRIVKYFDDIAKEDDENRYNLIKQRVDREDYTHREKDHVIIKTIADKVYDRIEKEEIRPVTYESIIRTGMDNRSYVQLEKKIHDNYLLVNDRVNELLERVAVIEKEVRE